MHNREKKLRHDKLSRQFFVKNLSNLLVIQVKILVARAIPAKKNQSNITTKLPSFDTMTKTKQHYDAHFCGLFTKEEPRPLPPPYLRHCSILKIMRGDKKVVAGDVTPAV